MIKLFVSLGNPGTEYLGNAVRPSLSLALISLLFAASGCAVPAFAQDCGAIAGEYRGRFTASRLRGAKDVPARIGGSWRATLARNCAMAGTVTSDLTGTVRVTGEYGGGRSWGNAFEPWRMFLKDPTMTKYSDFAFGNEGPNITWVGITNNDFSFRGTFTAEGAIASAPAAPDAAPAARPPAPQSDGPVLTRQDPARAEQERVAAERRANASAAQLEAERQRYFAQVRADEEMAKLNRELQDRQRCAQRADPNDCSCSRFFPPPPPRPGEVRTCNR